MDGLPEDLTDDGIVFFKYFPISHFLPLMWNKTIQNIKMS